MSLKIEAGAGQKRELSPLDGGIPRKSEALEL
jgi:hypothetical protein